MEGPRMKRFFRAAALAIILAWSCILNLYHAGVYPVPKVDPTETAQGEWLDRREYGINHLILQGPPFARGKLSGELTGPLLLAQEETLVAKLQTWLPSKILLQGVVLGSIAWFQGVDQYFDPAFVQEMYGTSLSAPKSFDYLADGFTRQVAYHGLHEVGQRMVDQGFEDMGCTVVALPYKTGYVLGRNFDFEGGRIFDTEKIVKWVFPDKGYAFASVIWAGMVGAVTGVNERGVYISINAGGSADYRRIGTPSTLVALKVLEEAANVPEALKILETAQMFITDIFVVTDASGQMVRVEKSPERMAVMPLEGSRIVTNHLISPQFKDDPINQFRINELTTIARFQRGLERLNGLPEAKSALEAETQVLEILRDKGVDSYGQPLNLGNRRAIDALIATHSVIYNSVDRVLFVSQGPAVAGPFLGFDLKESFRTRRPVQVATLPADPMVTPEIFSSLKEANLNIAHAERLVQFGRCKEAFAVLAQIVERWQLQSPYYQALGDTEACLGDKIKARESWTKALGLNPAYARSVRQLEKSLQQ
jgi:hypothetical protein